MLGSSESRVADTVTPVNRRTAVIDLAIAIGFFVVCYASEPLLDPLLRHGRGWLCHASGGELEQI